MLSSFDDLELVTMDGIRAGYLIPPFADFDDLALDWVEGHLPISFPGL